MICQECKAPLVLMIMSSFCPNDCDRKKTDQEKTPRIESLKLWLPEFPIQDNRYDRNRDLIFLKPFSTIGFWRGRDSVGCIRAKVEWFLNYGEVSYSDDGRIITTTTTINSATFSKLRKRK